MTNSKKIVAFCGSKGSGKSTSATIFTEILRDQVEEIAIAGHLKEACSRVFDVEMKHFLEPSLKEVEFNDLIVLDARNIQRILDEFEIKEVSYDRQIRPHVGRICRSPRGLLQYIGTEVLHPIDPLVHVKTAMRKRDPQKTTLITDLRFVAEFDYLKTNHASEFLPVYVRNPLAELRASQDSHASERQYVVFVPKCRLLNNEGSIQDLKRGIIELVGEV